MFAGGMLKRINFVRISLLKLHLEYGDFLPYEYVINVSIIPALYDIFTASLILFALGFPMSGIDETMVTGLFKFNK